MSNLQTRLWKNRFIVLLISGAMLFGSFSVRAYAENLSGSVTDDPFESVVSDTEIDVNETVSDLQPVESGKRRESAAEDGKAEEVAQLEQDVPTEESDPDYEALVEESGSYQEDAVDQIESGTLERLTEDEVNEEQFEEGVDALGPQAPRVSVSYATHVQNVGWQTERKDGKTAGTSGRSLRLESFRATLDLPEGFEGGIEYRAQVQNKGWLSWTKDGADCGTTGSSLRMEAIQVRLYGPIADEYDVYYRVHVQNYGWMSWASNGSLAGSTGRSLRLEALQVVLVPKGENPPAENPASSSSKAFIDGSNLSVSAHVQNRGWMRSVGSGKVAGTTGHALRVEALRVSLAGARVPGGIEGRAHVQNIGWQRWVSNGSIVGTTGRSLRVEAVRFRLTGEAADEWDLYYRAHVQNVGWLSWAKNGEVAGTEGVSARIEAVEFVLCEKGAAGPQEEFHFDGPFPLSGDEVVDSIVWRNVIENGWSGVSGLRSAFQYVCSFPYKSMSNWPGPDSERWSVTFAKEMLVNGGGNCHRYASLMRWFAKALGYEARAVPGKLGGVNGSDHGWLEIDVDGTTYVIDPAVRNAYPEYNWFLVRYEDAKLKYYDLDGVRILK